MNASHRPAAIDSIIGWIESRLGLSGKDVCDLGCGPGLYAERMAMHGARVTGLDFSTRSLAHARQSAEQKRLPITYLHGDYLKDELPPQQDIVTLIYEDFCVLSPEQRRALLQRVHAMLKPDGCLVFDAASRPQFGDRSEEFKCERRLMNGFWAEGDYVGFRVTHLYPDRHLSLDRYLIVEPGRTRQIYNWLQYFTPTEIKAELADAGFKLEKIFDLTTGGHWVERAMPFGVLARRLHTATA